MRSATDELIKVVVTTLAALSKRCFSGAQRKHVYAGVISLAYVYPATNSAPNSAPNLHIRRNKIFHEIYTSNVTLPHLM